MMVKNASVTISYEQEKLRALQFYAGKKEADIQSEMGDFLQKLYEKYVPPQTREYIESLAGPPQAGRERAGRPAPAPPPDPAEHGRPRLRETGE
jgi:hypothetical protein